MAAAVVVGITAGANIRVKDAVIVRSLDQTKSTFDQPTGSSWDIRWRE
jgi:hypothetical protein